MDTEFTLRKKKTVMKGKRFFLPSSNCYLVLSNHFTFSNTLCVQNSYLAILQLLELYKAQLLLWKMKAKAFILFPQPTLTIPLYSILRKHTFVSPKKIFGLSNKLSLNLVFHDSWYLLYSYYMPGSVLNTFNLLIYLGYW